MLVERDFGRLVVLVFAVDFRRLRQCAAFSRLLVLNIPLPQYCRCVAMLKRRKFDPVNTDVDLPWSTPRVYPYCRGVIDDPVPWKEELVKAAERLEAKTRQTRWTGRTDYLIERDFIVSAYTMRKLIESYDVSEDVRQRQ